MTVDLVNVGVMFFWLRVVHIWFVEVYWSNSAQSQVLFSTLRSRVLWYELAEQSLVA
jgi:hypothetical protein